MGKGGRDFKTDGRKADTGIIKPLKGRHKLEGKVIPCLKGIQKGCNKNRMMVRGEG